MIDTHAHLDFPEFDEDREEVIRRFFEQGGKAIINIGVDLERSRRSVEIAEKYDGIFASAGLHPDFFSHLPENFSKVQPFPSSEQVAGIPQGRTLKNSSRSNPFGELKNMARHKKVVAIGETGLDYFHITHNMEHGTGEIGRIKKNQKAGFIAQVEIAGELNLPVIVHCREAWNDLYEIISAFPKSPTFPLRERSSRNSSKSDFSDRTFTKFVLHCYSGEKKDTEKFLELPNVYFSFSGNITYPKPKERAEKLFEAVSLIPLDRILLDSDSPFLAPQEMRGKRNEPSYIGFIAKKISIIKKISARNVEEKTDENARKFFNLGKYDE